jgi:hypothetical protein
MRLFVSLLALGAFRAFLTVHATPFSPYDTSDITARSMMSDAVGWESLPLERSPNDPDPDGDLSGRRLEKRIVYNPPVTYPTRDTTWIAGQHETVRWVVDQNQIPEDAKNYKGTLKLGYIPSDGSGGYNLSKCEI